MYRPPQHNCQLAGPAPLSDGPHASNVAARAAMAAIADAIRADADAIASGYGAGLGTINARVVFALLVLCL